MSKEEDFQKYLKKVTGLIRLSFGLIIFMLIFLPFYLLVPSFFEFKPQTEITLKTIKVTEEIDEDRIENGIHVRTGLIDAEGLMTVVHNCTNCHSSKIILQNRMSTEGWNTTIKWMQETQNLWDLGENKEIIVNYLVANYPLKDKGRRENLSGIDWYELDN
jgi:hypothetical protein